MTTRPHWVFDDSDIPDPFGYGQRAVEFFDHLKHPLSTEPDGSMRLPRFWARIVKRIYGPRHPDGRRVVQRVTIMMPRGSRKTTTVSAGLGLLHAVGHERVNRGQVILASGSKDQAEFGLEEAKGIVESTPALRNKLLVRGDYLEHPDYHSRLRLVSSAGDITSSGSTPAAIFLDEFQYFRDRVLLKALKTGLVKRPNALFVITMNSGKGQVGPAWDEYQYARKVALGEIDNPAYLPVLFEPDSQDADPFDEELWRYTNPGLAEGYPNLNSMRLAAEEAKEKPAELEEFKQLNLGFWPDAATVPFISMPVYDEGAEPFDLADMRGLPCWLAVDLSQTRDLTAIVAVWRDGEQLYCWAWFYAPEANLAEREKKTSAPWAQWRDEGYIDLAGRVVDYSKVTAKIDELVATYDVREIAFDRALAQQVMADAEAKGHPAFDFPQRPTLMMPALMDMERAITDRKFRHGGHPVLRFCFANSEVKRTAMGEAKQLFKSTDWKSIDGAVAAAMAINRACQPIEEDWFDQHLAWAKRHKQEAANAA